MFKNLANLGSMLRTAQELGGRMQQVSEQLKHKRATASAGGGLVEIEVNGLGEVLKVRLDEQLVQRGDREMLEDLLPLAFNQAAEKVKELHMAAMQEASGGLDMAGLQAMLGKLGE